MSEHKTTNLHAPPPLGSVANTLSNQHQQKLESIDYTADESMIAVSYKFFFVNTVFFNNIFLFIND